jgi:heme A synthase
MDAANGEAHPKYDRSVKIHLESMAWGFVIVFFAYAIVFVYLLKQRKHFHGTKTFIGYFVLVFGQCIFGIMQNYAYGHNVLYATIQACNLIFQQLFIWFIAILYLRAAIELPYLLDL